MTLKFFEEIFNKGRAPFLHLSKGMGMPTVGSSDEDEMDDDDDDSEEELPDSPQVFLPQHHVLTYQRTGMRIYAKSTA